MPPVCILYNDESERRKRGPRGEQQDAIACSRDSSDSVVADPSSTCQAGLVGPRCARVCQFGIDDQHVPCVPLLGGVCATCGYRAHLL